MKYTHLSDEDLDAQPWRLSRNQLREQARRGNRLLKAELNLRKVLLENPLDVQLHIETQKELDAAMAAFAGETEAGEETT